MSRKRWPNFARGARHWLSRTVFLQVAAQGPVAATRRTSADCGKLGLSEFDLTSPWRPYKSSRPATSKISPAANATMSTDAKAYVIPQPPQAAIPVAGTGKYFPVRRLWCVGRNYVDIKEMGQDVREPPFFFAKPPDAIVPDGGTAPYPSLTKDMHHEGERVVALKSGGRNIATENALAC